MNQTCRVCGEPAAGFHFGAFTCEGCKSFFGRSYNNVESISECKNNMECTINKKNRTACKACRLRKCLSVGMSKSGSRYGRRSNWFKIHCLLQEQSQQAIAAVAAGKQKTPPPPSQLNMMGHPSYPQGLCPRPACTKEELMLLGFEDYNTHNNKHPSASPSVSSPDSHNSDSSVEVGDRRQSLLRQSQAQQNRSQLPPPPFNRELFLPLSFPSLMPPPGFLPPSHLMFSSYHTALYAQHQGLLKPAIDPATLMNSSHSMANNNSRFVPNNNNNKSAEEFTKRYLDAVLKSQRSPSAATIKSEEEEEMESDDIVVSITPSSSPPLRNNNNTDRNSTNPITTFSVREKSSAASSPQMWSASEAHTQPRSPPTLTVNNLQERPIDLSMKSSSSTSGDEQRGPLSVRSNADASDEDEIESKPKRRMSSSSCDKISNHDENSVGDNDALRVKVLGTKPLDLTTKV